MSDETIHPGKLAAFVKGCTQEFKSRLRDYLVSKYPLVSVLCYAAYARLTSTELDHMNDYWRPLALITYIMYAYIFVDTCKLMGYRRGGVYFACSRGMSISHASVSASHVVLSAFNAWCDH